MDHTIQIKEEVGKPDEIVNVAPVKLEKADSHYTDQLDRMNFEGIKEIKHENTIDIEPVQLIGESDNKIRNSSTKAENDAEKQVKIKDHPAAEVKCEKPEEPYMGVTKYEKMDVSQLTEELNIKPENDSELLSEPASVKAAVGREQRQVNRKSEEAFICYNCNFIFLRKCLLIRHIARKCGSKTKTTLRDSMPKKWSAISSTVTCLYCNATFKSKRVLDDHIINKHQLILSRRRRRKVHECSHCQYKTTYKRNFNQHVWIHTSRTFSTCQHCTMTFRSRPSLYDHIIREHPQFSASVNRKIYECSYCNYKTINNFIFNEHMSIHTGDKLLLRCAHCEATFKKKQSLDEHIVRKHPDFIASIARKILECPNCTFKSTSRFMLNEHLMQRSRQKCKGFAKKQSRYTSLEPSFGELFTCEHCDAGFRKQGSLDKHLVQKHSNLSPYSSCERCSATFKSKQSLYDHILKRHPDFSASVPYKHECPTCDYKTSKKDAFERHLLQHPKATDGSKVVSCQHCDTTYTSKERLGNHIIKEHPDLLAYFKGRIYECLYCTYKTTIKHYLTTHTRMHCRDEVNVCKHCDATFKRKISLCDHVIKKHPDLRASFPYKIQECSHCDYKTARKSDLDRHMMKHLDKSSNRNLDTCLHCNATYKSKRYLHDHIVKKHPDFIATVTSKIYTCSRCTFKTTRRDELKKHILMESV